MHSSRDAFRGLLEEASHLDEEVPKQLHRSDTVLLREFLDSLTHVCTNQGRCDQGLFFCSPLNQTVKLLPSVGVRKHLDVYEIAAELMERGAEHAFCRIARAV